MPYRISKPGQAAWLTRHLRDLPHEELHVIYLDPQGRVIDTVRVSETGDEACALSCIPRIFTSAVQLHSTRMILVHNHVGVDSQPSQTDIDMTLALRNGARFFGMRIIDHIILAKGYRHWSFQEALDQQDAAAQTQAV